jgi:hypothetical protein
MKTTTKSREAGSALALAVLPLGMIRFGLFGYQVNFWQRLMIGQISRTINPAAPRLSGGWLH